MSVLSLLLHSTEGFSPALQQVLAVAEIREDLEQQLQRIERHRQALTERKVAEQRRLIRLLDAQLAEACGSCATHERGLRELLGDAAGQLQACTGVRLTVAWIVLLYEQRLILHSVGGAMTMRSQSCWRRRLGSCKAAWVCDLLLPAIPLGPHIFGDSIDACQPKACPLVLQSHRLTSCQHRHDAPAVEEGFLLDCILARLSSLAHVQQCWTARRACQMRRRWQTCWHNWTSCSARGPCCSALCQLRPVCRQPPWLTQWAFRHR